jgi:hypothetical protein
MNNIHHNIKVGIGGLMSVLVLAILHNASQDFLTSIIDNFQTGLHFQVIDSTKTGLVVSHTKSKHQNYSRNIGPF